MIGEWLDIGWLQEIPVRGSRTGPVDGGEEIAVFRTGDDSFVVLSVAVRAVRYRGYTGPEQDIPA